MICNQIFDRHSVIELNLDQVSAMTAVIQRDEYEGRESCTDLLALRVPSLKSECGMKQKTQMDLCSRSAERTVPPDTDN